MADGQYNLGYGRGDQDDKDCCEVTYEEGNDGVYDHVECKDLEKGNQIIEYYKGKKDNETSEKMQTGKEARGGMRPGPWTWEEEEPPVSITYRPAPPTPPPEEIPDWALENTPLQTTAAPEESSLPPSEERSLPTPYVTRVHISPSVRTDVSCVDLIVKPGTTILHLRVRLAGLLAVPAHRIAMTDLDNSEVPFHHPVPNMLRVHDRWVASSQEYDALDVYLGPMGVDTAFIVRLCRTWTHTHVMEKLASIVGVTSNSITVTDLNGGEWTYPESRSTSLAVMLNVRRSIQDVAQLRQGLRGGMHQQNGDEEDGDLRPPLLPHEDLAEIAWDDDMRRPMHISPPRSTALRSRSRERPVPVLTETARCLMRHPPSEYYDAWWSKETTVRPPSSERQLMNVLLTHGEHHVGYVWAYKTAYAHEIVNELMEDLKLDSYVEIVPAQARRWDEVARLTIPNAAVVQARSPIDTRVSRWELYQAHKEIPMMKNGMVVRYVVIPQVTSLKGAQVRLNMHAPWEETWKIMAIDADNWVVVATRLPASVIRIICEYKSTLPACLREGDLTDRGGMNVEPTAQQSGPWIWGSQETQQNPSEDEEIPDWAIARTRRDQDYQVRVYLSPSIRSDLAYLTFKEGQVRTVGTLKMRLADILHTRKERIGVYSADNMHELLQEWMRTPTKVVIEDLMALPTPAFHYLNVYHRDAGQEFILRIHYAMDNDRVRLMLGAIVREDPLNVLLFDHNGAPWVHPESMATCTAAILVIQRGGMHSDDQERYRTPRRTVSTTLPFNPGSGSGSTDSPTYSPLPENQEEEHMNTQCDLRQQEWYQRCILPPHELPRLVAFRDVGALIPDETPSPASVQHDAEAYVHSMLPPLSPPAAQPRRVPKPVMDKNRLVGRAFAAEDALASAVLVDLADSILPHSPLWAGPGMPRLWKEVEVVFISSPQTIKCIHPLDVRRGVWEYYQRMRYVPIINKGLVNGTIVMSAELDMEKAQRRIDDYAVATRQWRLMCLTPSDWVVVPLPLPQDVQDDMCELEMRRAVQRGGMQHAFLHPVQVCD